MAPIMAAASDSRSAGLAQPGRRDTSQPACALQGVLPAHAGMARWAPAQLLAVLAG
jgi:hypothetical protein